MRQVIDEWLLLEYAVCFLPANQDALVESVSKGAVELPADCLAVRVETADSRNVLVHIHNAAVHPLRRRQGAASLNLAYLLRPGTTPGLTEMPSPTAAA